MPNVESNGLRLEYETFGNPIDPPLVLIMGLGAQLIAWPVALCEMLAEKGYHVVRFDNRDSGLSTHLHDNPKPDVAAILAGDFATASYRLSDFADDTVGLFDALGFEKVHVVGASMGGMIAQQLVIDHPDRVASLCSIMSTTGDPNVGQATPEALALLTRPPAPDRDAAIESGVAAQNLIGSPDYPTPDEVLAQRVAEAYDRSYDPAGGLRQTAAIVASGDRTEGLHGVHVPTVVIHGTKDPLVNFSGGEATVAAIPGATFVPITGMGHDLPDALFGTYVDAIVANAKA
jgi:pimeloyl-ACP methyl ester carboxylesterase